jgi:hypothetical protein
MNYKEMKNNPRINAQINVLQSLKRGIDSLRQRELGKDGSGSATTWTEFEQGKDHAYETVIFNIDRRIELLKDEEEE